MSATAAMQDGAPPTEGPRFSMPEPNYVNPERKSPTLLPVLAIVLFVISFCIVTVRVYCRRFILLSFGTDDWLIIASLLPAVAYTVCSVLGPRYGLGYHAVDMMFREGWMEKYLILCYVKQVSFISAVNTCKLSIVFTYARISRTSKTFRNLLIITGCLIIADGIGHIGATIFSCSPINAYWSADMHYRMRVCIKDSNIMISSNTVGLVLTLWLVILPQPILWSLHLPKRQRALLIFVMSIGLITAAAACAIRLHYLVVMLYKVPDVSWFSYTARLWTCVELHISIICASLPVLRPLLRRYFPELVGRVSSATGFRKTGSGSGSGGFETPVVWLHKPSPSMGSLRKGIIVGEMVSVTGSEDGELPWWRREEAGLARTGRTEVNGAIV